MLNVAFPVDPLLSEMAVPDTSTSNLEALGSDVRFILASRSKRRRDIMALTGLSFVVQDSAGSDAEISSDEEPDVRVLTLRNADTKLRAAVVSSRNRMPWNTVVLAADTVVAVDGESLGKPADHDEATRMLNRLRNRQHEVVTTVVLTYAPHRQRGDIFSDTVVSEVKMRDYDNREIEEYVASGAPYDRAGAYGIQDAGFDPAESVVGCYLNVVGLPLCAVRAMLPDGACTFTNAHIYATCAAHEARAEP